MKLAIKASWDVKNAADLLSKKTQVAHVEAAELDSGEGGVRRVRVQPVLSRAHQGVDECDGVEEQDRSCRFESR